MTRPNRNNEIVREKLARITTCINVLEARGLDVLAISIDGPMPLVEVFEGAACKEFRQAYTVRSNRNGHRVCERVAMVSDCQVRWLERD